MEPARDLIRKIRHGRAIERIRKKNRWAVPTLRPFILTFAPIPSYRSNRRKKLIAVLLLCAVALAYDALALWNAHTAFVPPRERIF